MGGGEGVGGEGIRTGALPGFDFCVLHFDFLFALWVSAAQRKSKCKMQNAKVNMMHRTPGLHVVGLLGGVASGKSLVARQLCELGAGALDGDAAGHEVLRWPEVEQRARARWGDGIFGADGHIHRPALAAIVFARTPQGRRELEYLEQITHPQIATLLRREIERLAAEGFSVAVLDAPVMLKAGWDRLCDRIVFVDVPDEVRRQRAKERGWSQEDFMAREAAQEPLQIKRDRADAVIDNSGSPAATRKQVERLWQSLVLPAA